MTESRLKTVTVPDEFREAFQQAEKTVEQYFEKENRHPERGTIEIDDERYFLVRAESISVDFFRTLKTLYPTVDDEVRQSLGHQLLFELAFNLGQSDARHFQETMDVDDPIQRLSTGPVHFGYSGWARVNIREDSNPSPDENYLLHYTHPNSFEADSWIESSERAEEPVCYMNAGYSSGWCSESFGIDALAVEVQCRATGGDHCEFVMAHSNRIEERLREYDGEAETFNQHRIPDVPDYVETRKLAETIREQEERIETLARLHEENPNPVLRVSPEGELLYFNEGARQHWAELELRKHRPIVEPFRDWVRSVRENGSTIKREFSTGGRWYRVELVPVHDLEYVNVYAVDVTDRKEAQEEVEKSLREKKLLIEELHHRIKNNLQIASSFLTLQERELESVAAGSALKRSRNRLNTMATIHEKLSGSEEESIRLDSYLKDLSNDIVDTYPEGRRVNLRFDMEAVLVESQVAVPCGLIVNELISNAIEHGLEGRTEGTLRLELGIDGDRYHLIVADDGGADVSDIDLEDPGGLGLTIVTSMIRDYLDGTVDLDVEEWTEFDVRFRI